MNVPILKRRIALMKSVGKPQDAIQDLVQFVDSFPTDMEAWCELSDLYYGQGFTSQAIFCLEEAIVIAPHTWMLHARLGELEYMAATASNDNAEVEKHLTIAVQRFSRSIELCDDFLRGFYGLRVAADKLLQVANASKANADHVISADSLEKLALLARTRLEAILKDRTSSRTSPAEDPEVIAAQELLDRLKG
jgi:ER membrane protein complex subunit 2